MTYLRLITIIYFIILISHRCGQSVPPTPSAGECVSVTEVAMTFCTPMMNPTDFGDALTFTLVPLAG